MKQRGAELVRKRLQGKTVAQQVAYWKRGTEELKILQRKLKSKT
jgi:hypothetical protein